MDLVDWKWFRSGAPPRPSTYAQFVPAIEDEEDDDEDDLMKYDEDRVRPIPFGWLPVSDMPPRPTKTASPEEEDKANRNETVPVARRRARSNLQRVAEERETQASLQRLGQEDSGEERVEWFNAHGVLSEYDPTDLRLANNPSGSSCKCLSPWAGAFVVGMSPSTLRIVLAVDPVAAALRLNLPHKRRVALMSAVESRMPYEFKSGSKELLLLVPFMRDTIKGPWYPVQLKYTKEDVAAAAAVRNRRTLAAVLGTMKSDEKQEDTKDDQKKEKEKEKAKAKAKPKEKDVRPWIMQPARSRTSRLILERIQLGLRLPMLNIDEALMSAWKTNRPELLASAGGMTGVLAPIPSIVFQYLSPV
jgi:hypothetical protein